MLCHLDDVLGGWQGPMQETVMINFHFVIGIDTSVCQNVIFCCMHNMNESLGLCLPAYKAELS